MDEFKEILLIITSILTIGGVFIKIFHNFFFEIVKVNRQAIPGKQSLYELGTAWGVLSVTIFSILTLIKDELNKIQFNNKDLVYAIALLLFIAGWITIIVIISVIYSKIAEDYVKYMDNKNITKKSYKKYKMMIWIVAVVACIYSDLWIWSIATADLKTILINGVFGVSSIMMFILAFNLKRAIRDIADVKTYYMIYTNKEVICCKNFVECGAYYRVLENKDERFIKSNEVYEIRKIKNS